VLQQRARSDPLILPVKNNNATIQQSNNTTQSLNIHHSLKVQSPIIADRAFWF